MKYLSIDLETTGLDTRNDQILEVGMVLEDTKFPNIPVEDLPFFHCLIGWPTYRFSHPIAAVINRAILEQLADDAVPRIKPHELTMEMIRWLEAAEVPKKITIAGKNYANFDQQFLLNHRVYSDDDVCFKSEGSKLLVGGWSFRGRVLDPANLFWQPSDEELPNTSECLVRAGCDRIVTTHSAVEDARDVIRMVRTYLRNQ